MTPEELVEALTKFDYPAREDLSEEADMVMKGGITSGIMYPLAVCEMARTRRFRNLGGSSAGGIAAAMAAGEQQAVDRTDLFLGFVGRRPGAGGAHDPVPRPDFTAPRTEPDPIPDMRIVAHF